MSRWFRHYAGMMRDDKLVRVALRSGQPIERVVWIWGAILESAAEIDDNGKYDLDAPEIAYFLRADLSDVESVLSALEASDRIGGSSVVKWGNRQFSSDTSAERQRRYRDKKRAGESDVPTEVSDARVTSLSRHRDAPETETELDTEITPIVPLAGGRRGKILLSLDWKPPAKADLPPRARACAEQWTEASYQTEAEGFVLYWRSERKMKADWDGTWANRIISRNSAVMRDQKFGNGAPEIPKYSAPRTPEEAHVWWSGQVIFYRGINREDDAVRCEEHVRALEVANPELTNKVTNMIDRVTSGMRVSKARAA